MNDKEFLTEDEFAHLKQLCLYSTEITIAKYDSLYECATDIIICLSFDENATLDFECVEELDLQEMTDLYRSILRVTTIETFTNRILKKNTDPKLLTVLFTAWSTVMKEKADGRL